jgi:hypothetical protein
MSDPPPPPELTCLRCHRALGRVDGPHFVVGHVTLLPRSRTLHLRCACGEGRRVVLDESTTQRGGGAPGEGGV